MKRGGKRVPDGREFNFIGRRRVEKPLKSASIVVKANRAGRREYGQYEWVATEVYCVVERT